MFQKKLDGILKIILGDAYDEKKDQYDLYITSCISRESVLNKMYKDFKKLKIEVNIDAVDEGDDFKSPEDVCAERGFDEYFTQENIHEWIKDNFLERFPDLIKKRKLLNLNEDKIKVDIDSEGTKNKTKNESVEEEEFKPDNLEEGKEEIEKIGEKSKTKTSCSKTVIIFVVVACLFAILVIGLVSYFVTRNSNNGEIKSDEDSSKKNEQSSQVAKPADADPSWDQEKENETAQIQHTGISNVGKWIAGISSGTVLASIVTAGAYAKNRANSNILNKTEASEKTEPIGLKGNKTGDLESENNHNIVKDDEVHSTQASEKSDAVKNNEEEEVKTKR